MRFSYSTDDWPLHIRQVRNWVIVLILLGCYFMFTKENVFTALVKAVKKEGPKEQRARSQLLGIFCFCQAANEVLTLLADYYQKKWLDYVLPAFCVILLIVILIQHACKKKNKTK